MEQQAQLDLRGQQGPMEQQEVPVRQVAQVLREQMERQARQALLGRPGQLERPALRD